MTRTMLKGENGMSNEISRRGFLGRVGAVGALVATTSSTLANAEDWGGWSNERDWLDIDHVDSIPDPAHLLRWGTGWKVLPTGHHDHDNLEWALRNTVSGGTVRLVPGTYKIGSPILVPDFDGPGNAHLSRRYPGMLGRRHVGGRDSGGFPAAHPRRHPRMSRLRG
jgi:hypothetical protein